MNNHGLPFLKWHFTIGSAVWMLELREVALNFFYGVVVVGGGVVVGGKRFLIVLITQCLTAMYIRVVRFLKNLAKKKGLHCYTPSKAYRKAVLTQKSQKNNHRYPLNGSLWVQNGKNTSVDISLEIWTNYMKIVFLYHTLVVVRPTNILQEGAISPQTSSKFQKQLLGGQKPNQRKL